MAATPCVPLSNLVVLLPFSAPPAAIARAIADMLSSSGTSAMMTRSYSTKQYQPPTSLPPTASHAALPTDSTRFCGFFSCVLEHSRGGSGERREVDLKALIDEA